MYVLGGYILTELYSVWWFQPNPLWFYPIDTPNCIAQTHVSF